MKRSELFELSEKVRREVSIVDVLSKYGYELNRNGFICCPFHQEKTASMKIFQKTNSFYCFGCGAGGDIFMFVQKLFNISFSQSILRLANDFCITHSAERDREAAKYRAQRRREKLAQAQKEREYLEKCREFREMNRAIYELAPRSVLDEPHPYFVYSLIHINELREWLDDPENQPERRNQ